MPKPARNMRLLDLGAFIALLAIAFALLHPVAATLYAVYLLPVLASVALGRTPAAVLLVLSLLFLPLFWIISAAIDAARA